MTAQVSAVTPATVPATNPVAKVSIEEAQPCRLSSDARNSTLITRLMVRVPRRYRAHGSKCLSGWAFPNISAPYAAFRRASSGATHERALPARIFTVDGKLYKYTV